MNMSTEVTLSSGNTPQNNVYDYPRTATLHGLFSDVAKQYPQSHALVADGAPVTFADLDHSTNQLARSLRQMGVQPGSIVGLLTDRSAETVAAMIAVLKCGAAYAPLDPAYPLERLAYMVADCKPVVILANREHTSKLSGAETAAAVVCLEDTIAASSSLSSAAEASAVTATDVAYVMYTSGSTGTPKGVMVPHRGLVRLVWKYDVAGFAPGAVVLQLTSLSFDPSQLEIWGALVNGCKLAVVTTPVPSLDQIAEAIKRFEATFVSLTTGLFHYMVEHRLADLVTLRCIFAGGDVLSPVHAAKAVAALPNTRLVNAYGPTENSVMTCAYVVPREGWGAGSVPIGTAVPNSTIYILGGDLEPVPEGEEGELCAGGDGVALGYLNNPELTAHKFVPDKFSQEPGARMYRTGDMVRMRSDGLIEFAGRKDRQVKINGKRVELDEIENIIREDERLADAAVLLREDRPGVHRLTAYFKPAEPWPESEHGARTDAIMQALQARLPSHMLPSDVVVLETFPLTLSGKVDRKLLPAPERHGRLTTPSVTEHPECLSGIERQLAEIWCEVLGLTSCGRHDNFFDLGGTSMMMIRVHAEIQERIRPDVSKVSLFEHPNIADLAAFLGNEKKVTGSMAEARERAKRQSGMVDRMRQARKGRPQ